MKNKLIITILSVTLSAFLFSCGQQAAPAGAGASNEEESTDTPFSILTPEITLACGTPFDTDDLSKYIKADSYEDILINFYRIEKSKSSIDEIQIPEEEWDRMGAQPETYKVVFEKYTPNDEYSIYSTPSEFLTLNYVDTTPPSITLMPDIKGYENEEFTCYSIGIDSNELRYKKDDD